MARIRMIKPEFFDDSDVAELSPLARLLFIGLWTEADKEGRLVADMRRLKTRILPYDNVDIEALAEELSSRDMIRRYSDGEKHGYIWIKNFTKHQRPHPKEPPSVIPKCTAKAVERNVQSRKETEGTPESGSLILDSGSLDSGVRNLEAGTTLPSVAVVSASKSDALRERFDLFWLAYPKKKAKDDAFKAWTKRKPNEAMTQAMIAAIEKQKTWPEWLKQGGEYIPYPATWLNKGSWDDEITAPMSMLSDVGIRNARNGALALKLMEEHDHDEH